MKAPLQQAPMLPIRQVQRKIERDEGIELGKNLAFLIDYRWMIAGIAFFITCLGLTYALIAQPIYEANILIQVEDSASGSNAGSPKNIQSDLSTVFDIKTATASEIEILRSRAVVSRAVEHALLYISVQPKYFLGIGSWIARRNKSLSDPGLFGYGGYVWGAEQADVTLFNVPEELEGRPFVLTAEENGTYRLERSEDDIVINGTVGTSVTARTHRGEVSIKVDRLAAKPGAAFILTRNNDLDTIEKLQKDLRIAERGKQSGIIAVTLEGPDPRATSAILNQIGREYVRLNVDRKSEKAQKSLLFLDKQLPDLKEQLERSENRYREFRNKHKTFDLASESKSMLDQSVWLQTRLTELDQKKIELEGRYQAGHPALAQLNLQMNKLTRRLNGLNERIKDLPEIEQEALHLSREVKVNTELYTTLLGTAQQLRLATSSEVGNARLLDTAATPIRPVKPKALLIVTLASLAGVALGVIAAFARKTIYGRIDDPHEVELLGLPVSATIPYSESQARLSGPARSGAKRLSVLPQDAPFDSTLESLRRLRNSLQFAMLDSSNNIIMITGPTPRVGKSFVSVNFAVVMGSIGKRVLLIDADLRAGDLHRYFGMTREIGLSDLIAGKAGDHAIRKGVVENVDFVPSGTLPSRPAELLANVNFGEILKHYSARYDFVLIDTPPVLAASDALSVASHAGVILNVVRGGVTTVNEIEEAVKWLNVAGYSVTGTVFNDFKAHSRRYGYGYGYGMKDSK